MPVLTNGLVVMTPSSVDKTGTGSTATINSNGSVTFDTCTALSLNGVFTSSYDNYMITIRGNAASGSPAMNARLRTGGTDSTATTDYNEQRLTANSTTISGARTTNLGYWTWAAISSTYKDGSTGYIFGPNLSQPTAYRTVGAFSLSGGWVYDVAGTHELSTSYDGITFYTSSSTTTGLVTVFGFNQ